MASRSLADLMPEARIRAEAFLELCHLAIRRELGVWVFVTGTLRTYAEQASLYAKGRHEDHPGRVVTNARPGYSWHNVGRAFDVAFRTPGGGASWDGPWQQVGDIGESVGLEWGGRWQSLKDYPHFQVKSGRTIDEARYEFEQSSLFARMTELEDEEINSGAHPRVNLAELGLA